MRVECYSSKNENLQENPVIVWIRGVSLNLFTSRHSLESLRSIENRHKSEYDLEQFLERTVLILTFEPSFTGDAAILFQTEKLPGNFTLVLRVHNVHECHSLSNSKLLVFEED